MAIEVPNSIHAALTVFIRPSPLLTTELETTSRPPAVDELPLVSSYGCSVFDVSEQEGIQGVYLVKLDYPLAAEQCACHITPMAFFPAGSKFPVLAPSPEFLRFVAHLDDTFKVIFISKNEKGDAFAGPFHCTFINFHATPRLQPLVSTPLPPLPSA